MHYEGLHGSDLINLMNACATHVPRGPFTVAARVGVHSCVFTRLKDGHGCRIDTFQKVFGWFNENWPGDLEWPRHIPRPPKSKKEAVSVSSTVAGTVAVQGQGAPRADHGCGLGCGGHRWSGGRTCRYHRSRGFCSNPWCRIGHRRRHVRRHRSLAHQGAGRRHGWHRRSSRWQYAQPERAELLISNWPLT